MNVNSNSMDRAFANKSKQEAYNPGKFEMGTVAPSMVGRTPHSVRSSKVTTYTAEQRIDQIVALFRKNPTMLKAIHTKPTLELEATINGHLDKGQQVKIDSNDIVRDFLGAVKLGYVASEGFDTLISNSEKAIYVPAKERDSILIKSSYGQPYLKGKKAIFEFSLKSLAQTIAVPFKTLEAKLNAQLGSEINESTVFDSLEEDIIEDDNSDELPLIAGSELFEEFKGSNNKGIITAEQRIDQICALFKDRARKAKTLLSLSVPEMSEALEDMLLASVGSESKVDKPAVVKDFLGAVKLGYVASEGFEDTVPNKHKAYYVPLSQRNSVYLKSTAKSDYFGVYPAIKSFSISSLATALKLDETKLKAAIAKVQKEAPVQNTVGDRLELVKTENMTAYDLATLFLEAGFNDNKVQESLIGTVNESKLLKVLSVLKAMKTSV